MKIKKIRLYKVPLTSHETYYMAEGKTCDTVDTIVLHLETDTNMEGWGEICPIPHYLPAYSGGVIPAIEEMAPVLLSEDFTGPSAMMTKLDSYLQGHDYAKSAIDMALWDLQGKIAKMPLYQMLGGRLNKDMPLYHSITCIAPQDMANMAIEAKEKGIRQIQVKLGADNNWEADIERLSLVREAVGPGLLVYGDWNCGATQLEATRVGRAVRHLDIMLEQPCKTLEQCASVRQATNLPMKIDENGYDIASLLKASQLGCMDAVALKLSKFSGLSKMRTARDLCLHLGAQMCIEDTWGSDLTTGTALHLAAATPSQAILNVCDLSGYVYPRLDESAPTRKDGRIAPSEGYGIGVEPDRDVLGQAHAILD